MALARGQAAERVNELLAGEACGFVNGEAIEQLSQGRATGERGRAAIGEETRGGDAVVADTKRETQAVAADGIR